MIETENKPIDSLTNEELIIRIQNGEKELINVLYKKIEGLIVKLANDFYQINKYKIKAIGTFDMDDLVQLSAIKFLRAVELFNSDSGILFSTYLCTAVKYGLTDSLFSSNYISKKDLLNDTQFKLEGESKNVRRLKEMYEFDMSKTDIDNLQHRTTGKHRNMIDKMYLEYLLEALNDREKEIIEDYYIKGYFGDYLSDKYNISRQRIQTIKQKALDKMKKRAEEGEMIQC